MAEAREVARQKMLQRIKRAADDDWRAAAEWLRLTFPADYRRPASNTAVEVNTAVQTGIVCDEATRARLIALRAEMGAPITLPAPERQPQDVQGGQAHIPEHNGGAATTEALPVGKPCPAFSAPAGATAPSDASPTYRAWLEHEKAEPEPGPNRGDDLPEDDTQVPSVGL